MNVSPYREPVKRVLRRRLAVRRAVIAAFRHEPVPQSEGFTEADDAEWYPPREPLTPERKIWQQRYRSICRKREFRKVRGKPWYDLTWLEARDLNQGGLSYATYRYYIQAKMLAPRAEGEVLNLWDDWMTWLRPSSDQFFRTCTPDEVEACWLYVKLLALEGGGIAKKTINEFFAPLRTELLGRSARVRWDPEHPWNRAKTPPQILGEGQDVRLEASLPDHPSDSPMYPVVIVKRRNSSAHGSIPCQLFWDNRFRGVAHLPAIPQVGSEIMLEGEDVHGNETRETYRVMHTAMTVRPVSPRDYCELATLPDWSSYVKLYLEYVGPSRLLDSEEK